MTRTTAIWVGFGIVLLHNLEELFTMGHFLAAHREELPSFLRPISGEQFSVSLAIFTAMALVATVAAARRHQQGSWLLLVIAMHVSLGVNALPHAATAAWVRGYIHRLGTGPSILDLPRAACCRDCWVTVRSMCLTATALIAFTLPFLMGLHFISGALAGVR